MAANFNKEKAYSDIVKKLIEKLPKEADKKFVSENIDVITKNLVTFSDYVRKVIDISVEKIPISSKIKKVTETKIFDSTLKLDEAREIINKLYQEFNKKIQIGGAGDDDVGGAVEGAAELGAHVLGAREDAAGFVSGWREAVLIEPLRSTFHRLQLDG